MFKKLLLLAATVASAPCFAGEVPSQFIAKQYTEGLGRAPDASGWQAATNYSLGISCGQPSLQALSQNLFGSSEFTGKGYTPSEAVLTVYRAVLSREPDPSGFAYYKAYMESGHTASEVVAWLMSSPEFQSLIPSICSGQAYGPQSVKPALDIGGGTWTQTQVESCLANSPVGCAIPPNVIVKLDSRLVIPAGKVLETRNAPDHTMYARQARIVRNGAWKDTLVLMKAGSTLRNVWLSGGRDWYRSSLVLPPAQQTNVNLRRQVTMADVYPNINYVGGDGGKVSGVRSDAPLSATHIQTSPVPTPSVPTTPTAFLGSIVIDNNLTTGYAQSHYVDDTLLAWADGISNHITNATITNNHIVDPTDVGIVLFGHDNSTQASTVSGNLIVHAGLSSYGSLGLDTLQCLSSHSNCLFSGKGISGNTVLAGRHQHSDIMLYNGTGGWAPPTCSGVKDQYCGTGGVISNNTTIMGDANQAIMVQVGLMVDGMLGATTSGNTFNVVPVVADTQSLPLTCAAKAGGAMIVNGAGHSGGTVLQAGATADADHCIQESHYVPRLQAR